MSRLEELIQRLCPDGVQTLQVGDFAKAETVRNKNYNCVRAYSITQRGLIPTNEYFKEAKVTSEDTSNYKIVKHNWFVYSPSRIDVGSINYLQDEEDVIVSPLNVVFSIKEDIILPQYLLAFLNSKTGTWQILSKREGIEGTGRKMLPFGKFSTIKVPVPPLEVQQEIVRILEQFTQLTAELTAELTARKKQHSFYLDNLLTFENNVPVKKIGDITRVFSAARVHKNEWTAQGIPFFRSSDVVSFFNQVKNPRGKAYISEELYEKLSQKSGKIQMDDILVTGGGTIGIPYIVPNNEPLYMKDADLICIQRSEAFDSKFLYYYFLSTQFRNHLSSITHNATIAHYTIEQVSNTPIPLPPLPEQRRIVSILDRFDALCNDLTSGLPAEIAARQKQYEYYRDKLLTFPERKEADA